MQFVFNETMSDPDQVMQQSNDVYYTLVKDDAFMDKKNTGMRFSTAANL